MKRKLLPQLQRAVLDRLLFHGHMPGSLLRLAMAKKGYHFNSGPAFYQLMKRLEEQKLVVSWYSREESGDRPTRIKNYKITATGAKRLEETMKVIGGGKK